MRSDTLDRDRALTQLGFATTERPTPEELKRRYRQLARKWHPDRNDAPVARTHFDEAAKAYEFLIGPMADADQHSAGTRPSPGGRPGNGSRSDRRAGRFAAPAVPVVIPDTIDFGVVTPGTWTEPIFVEVRADRPTDPDDQRIPRVVDLDAVQRGFWTRTDLPPDPSVNRAHLLLSFEANIPQDTPTGTLEDQIVIGFGKHSVTVPIVVRVMRPPSIALQPRKDGLRVDLAPERSRLHGASIAVDWGDGTTTATPTHTYARGGSYTVTVTAENAADSVIQTYRLTVVDTNAVAHFEQRHRGYQALRNKAVNRDSLAILIVVGVIATSYRLWTFGGRGFSATSVIDVVSSPANYHWLTWGLDVLSASLVAIVVVGLAARPLLSRRRRQRIADRHEELRRLLTDLGDFDRAPVTIDEGPAAKLPHSPSVLRSMGRIVIAIPCGAVAAGIGFVATWIVFYIVVAIYAAIAGDSLDSDAYEHHFFPNSLAVIATLWVVVAVPATVAAFLSD